MVSFYEIAIKMNVGKFGIHQSLEQFYVDTINNQMEVLPISAEYLSTYAILQQFPNHKDPFDRLIIATAISENLTMVSTDNKFEFYKKLVSVIWQQ